MELAKKRLGSPQFHCIYEHIYTFVQTNLFLSCWKEVKQVAALCEGHGQIGLKETEGILQFRLRGEEGYFQNFNITVPYMYPEEPLVIDFLKSQFPDDMQRGSYAQVKLRSESQAFKCLICAFMCLYLWYFCAYGCVVFSRLRR